MFARKNEYFFGRIYANESFHVFSLLLSSFSREITMFSDTPLSGKKEINMKTLNLNGLTYVNLTPHEIVVQKKDGTSIVAIPASGTLARVSQDRVQTGVDVNGIPYTDTVYGEVEGLPDPQPDTVYIVSGVLAQKVNRPDVHFPDQLVRDELGHVVGCLSLGK